MINLLNPGGMLIAVVILETKTKAVKTTEKRGRAIAV